jgi:Uma2 family endonuclease
MTAIPQLPPAPAVPFVPKPHHWTCEQFHDMGDAGALEGHSVILVDGEILAMPNPSPAHDTATSLTDYLLKDYARQHPTTAVLVVEVADSSLTYDTGPKAHLYAAAGIADYWVIDVNGGHLVVFRDPVADAAAPRGFRYNSVLTLARGQSVNPLAAPTAVVQVADLLP